MSLSRPAIVVASALSALSGPPAEAATARLSRIGEIAPAIKACWSPPRGLAKMERVEVTVRFSLRRDGALVGPPRVTFAGGGLEPRGRELLTRSTIEAVELCTPLRLADALGAEIAGRPFSIRFIYNGPQGQGV